MNVEKQKLKYSFWNNLRFIFNNMWRWNARLTVLTMLRAPFIVIIPLLGLYISRTVVLFIESGADMSRIVAGIVTLCAVTMICMVILNYLNGQNRRMEYVNGNRYMHLIFNKLMSNDYEYNESPKGLSDAMKAIQSCGSDISGARKAIDTASSFVGNCVGLITYATLIITLNPLILLSICVTTVASYFLVKQITIWNHKNKDNWISLDRKIEHLEVASKDLEPAKDIRLYNMAGWLRDLFSIVIKQRMEWQRKEETHAFGIDMLCVVLSFIREATAYGLLVYMMYQNTLQVADFVLFFGVIAGFTMWFDGLVDNLYWFDRVNVGFNEMREYLDYDNRSNHNEGIPLPNETFSVEFQNVSYRFSDSEKDFFQNFNLTIQKGEKLAVVGLNGAGKTTLAKLLCGMYRPTDGRILVDGQSIDDYNIDELFSLFSAVFQDITILPMTICQNIACMPGDIDDVRLVNALIFSGFSDVVEKLENGVDTYLVRGIYPEAIDLSGGEIQKLALARALYRDSKFLILDEPTASLDSIAESKIYEQYNSIAAGKTSVFISHRLASTRFCDRIIFVEDGAIAEEGTHYELMIKEGKYYELFNIQSHYYKEEVEAI